VVAREVLSTLRTGLLPLARLRALPSPDPRPELRPVVLVHGFLGHPEMFRPLTWRLLEEGFPQVVRVAYPSTRLHLEEIVEEIAARVADLGHRRKVDLVGHSLGAVACRAWLKAFGGAKHVERFVSLGGPHAGTSFYRLVPRPLRPAMDPRGPWVQRLSEGREPVPTVVIRARYDHQVFPPQRGAIPGAREVVLHGFGHNGLLWSPEAHDAVIQALTEELPDDPGAA